jgi:hypothetical protein
VRPGCRSPCLPDPGNEIWAPERLVLVTTVSLREKVEFLINLDYSTEYLKLLLLQKTMSKKSKEYVETLYKIVTENKETEKKS